MQKENCNITSVFNSDFEDSIAVSLFWRVGKPQCEDSVDPALHDSRNTQPINGELQDIGTKTLIFEL